MFYIAHKVDVLLSDFTEKEKGKKSVC